MASFFGLDSLHRTRFLTFAKDLHLGHHGFQLSDGLLLAFVWASLLMSTDLVVAKTSALRRIQNIHPYRGFTLWTPSKETPDYDYIVEASPDEGEEESPPAPPGPPRLAHHPPPIPQPPLPPHHHLGYPPQSVHHRLSEERPTTASEHHHHTRPSEEDSTFHTRPPDQSPPPPRTLSFDGNFHISRDQFVPFEPDDARVSRTPPPQTMVPPGSFRPPARTLPFSAPDFTPSYGNAGLQHAGIARPDGVSREVVHFATPDAPADDSALYYSPPSTTTTTTTTSSTTTTTRYPYVRDDEEDKSDQRGDKRDSHALGDQPQRGDSPTYLSRPDSGHPGKRWHGGGSAYLGPKGTSSAAEPPPRTNSALTELYYPSEFTSQSPGRTRHHSFGFTTPSSPSQSPTVIDGRVGPNLTDFGRYRNQGPTAGTSFVDEGASSRDRRPTSSVIDTAADSEIPSSEKPISDQDRSAKRNLSTGAIAGIAIGILAPLALVAGATGYLIYGRHFKSVAHKADGRSGAERGSYIDDSVRPSGYMNSHIELPKESSEEMTSLDNDSFLNSLEAVTIQNYWAESAKNTKV